MVRFTRDIDRRGTVLRGQRDGCVVIALAMLPGATVTVRVCPEVPVVPLNRPVPAEIQLAVYEMLKLMLPPVLPVVTVWTEGLPPCATLKARVVLPTVRFCASTVSKLPRASKHAIRINGVNPAAAIRNLVSIIPIEALWRPTS